VCTGYSGWLFRSVKTAGEWLTGGRPLHQFHFVSSGAEYTPLGTRCQQYIVVPVVLGAIECILPQIKADLLSRPSVGKQQLVVADVAIVTVEGGERVRGLFEHLFGHRD
jgi:hypothetical protein